MKEMIDLIGLESQNCLSTVFVVGLKIKPNSVTTTSTLKSGSLKGSRASITVSLEMNSTLFVNNSISTVEVTIKLHNWPEVGVAGTLHCKITRTLLVATPRTAALRTEHPPVRFRYIVIW